MSNSDKKFEKDAMLQARVFEKKFKRLTRKNRLAYTISVSTALFLVLCGALQLASPSGLLDHPVSLTLLLVSTAVTSFISVGLTNIGYPSRILKAKYASEQIKKILKNIQQMNENENLEPSIKDAKKEVYLRYYEHMSELPREPAQLDRWSVYLEHWDTYEDQAKESRFDLSLKYHFHTVLHFIPFIAVILSFLFTSLWILGQYL